MSKIKPVKSTGGSFTTSPSIAKQSPISQNNVIGSPFTGGGGGPGPDGDPGRDRNRFDYSKMMGAGGYDDEEMYGFQPQAGFALPQAAQPGAGQQRGMLSPLVAALLKR